MYRKLLLGVLVAFVAASSSASATATKTYTVGGTIHAAVVQVVNGGATLAGSIADTHIGKSAIVYRAVRLGVGATATFTAYAAGGSFSGTAVYDNVMNPDGSITTSNGKLTITKGTGAYKGAKGKGTFSGGSKSGFVTLTYRGSFRVPR